MSTIAVNAITDASGGNTASINGATPTTDNTMGRNRIINGDMRIDQRNAGASVTALDAYAVDRWQYEGSQSLKFTLQQNAGSVTPPAGFVNYYGATSSSAYSVGASDFFFIGQRIEGFNVADLGWGTANAATITLSFWVRSSLTGTFGGALVNSAGNRSYPFSYTISSANTFEYKTITVPGDTAGTWVTNNGLGIRLRFSLGAGSTFSGTAGAWSGSNLVSATGATSVVGTSGATFYLTGVQLEVGSVATSFERVDYGEMLRRCQRYYWKFDYSGSGYGWALSAFRSDTATVKQANIPHPVRMRSTPTVVLTSSSGTVTTIGNNTDNSVASVSGVTTTGGAYVGSFTADAEI